MKQIMVFFILIIIFSGSLWGDTVLLPRTDSPFSFHLMPGVTVPVGTYSDIFKPGSGITLSLAYEIPSFPVFVRGCGTYNYVPLISDYSISLVTLHVDGGMNFHLTHGITASPFAGIGYYYGFLNNNLRYYGSHPYGALGIECTFSLSKEITIGIDAGYRHFFGLYDDLHLSVSTSLSFPGKESALDLSPPNFYDIFPVLLNYYRDNPVGSVSIYNKSPEPVTLSNISLYIKDFMKKPRVTPLNREVGSSHNLDVELFAHFTENILDLEARQETKATIRIEYLLDGEKKREKLSYPVTIHPRTMISRNNPGQIGAFIGRDDPAVDKFAKSLKKTMNGYTLQDINPNILIAIGVYNAIKIYGINLVEQPQNGGHETVQFPGTTLAKKQGDTVDMAVLLSSVFESMDVHSALIYTPETCFIAFSLDIDPGSVKELYTNIDNIIIVQDSTWIPLDITKDTDNFFQAVNEGSKKWKKYNSEDTKLLYPVSDLQKPYTDLNMPENQPGPEIEPLQKEELKKQNEKDLSEYLYQDSTPKPLLLETVKEENEEDIRMMNSLAILYAKYTYYDKAITILNNILLKEDYVPALINMGNIYFLMEEMKKARSYFERAYEKDPIHPVILLNLARVNYAMENYGNAKESYRKLISIDEKLADQYDYLEYSGQEALIRSTKTEKKKEVIWIEEE